MSRSALINLSAVAMLLTVAPNARAQATPSLVASGSAPSFSYVEPQKMSGPRAGLIYFANGITKVDEHDERRTSSHLMSIFGWQMEDQSFQLSNGLTGMTEAVLSVAGIDQHLFLPAASLLVALRTRSGAELAIGPTLSPTEINLTFVAGRSVKIDGVRFPINVALVTSATGPRLSLTTGWIIDR